MTQLEKFTALLDEMGVLYSVGKVTYGDAPTGYTLVSIATGGDGTDIMFDAAGNCSEWS